MERKIIFPNIFTYAMAQAAAFTASRVRSVPV
jgi:hypothetical protein